MPDVIIIIILQIIMINSKLDKNIHILVPQSIKEKLKEVNEYYIIKISKAEIIAQDKDDGIIGLYNEVEIMRVLGHSDYIMN